ncbi:hypothetical protein KC334_g3818, partial [Hortaea werneckii]
MGQPRASRRKVAISSDEEDETAPPATAAASSDDEKVQTSKRTTGKLKSATKTKTRPQRASVSARTQQNEKKSSELTAKSRTNPKTKVTEREEPKAKKPIYSFFNATTQRQREAQPSASPEKPVSQGEPEAIHDESENDDASVTLSKGSSVALAMRKRKAQSS